MQDTFNIKLHAFQYIRIKESLNLRFSLTWEFIQAASDRRFSDTMSGNLAWIDKATGAIAWTPHLSRVGVRSNCFHTMTPDLVTLVMTQLKESSHLKPMLNEWHDQYQNEPMLSDLPELGDLEVELS